MPTILGLLSVIALGFSTIIIVRLLRSSGTVNFMLCSFTVFTGQVVIIGYFLSWMDTLSRVEIWLLFSMGFLAISLAVASSHQVFRQRCFKKIEWLPLHDLISWHRQLPRVEKILLISMLLTAFSLGIINLVQIIYAAPFNWDSMTYHLARVGYYLQYDNLNHFDANNWAQVIHPKGSTLLLIYAFLASGRNEHLTQLVQFGSYWIAILSVYGISRRLRSNIPASLFSALTFALLIEVLMEAITTQNDLLLTAYVGCTVYFLCTYREIQDKKCLVLAGLTVGLATGVKSNALLIFPSIAIITLYTILWQPTPYALHLKIKGLGIFIGAIVIGLGAFALPSGYLQNYRIFGHPMGPPFVRKAHSFEGESIPSALVQGTKNLLRYSIDFISLDGLPPIEPVRAVQANLREAPGIVLRSLGVDLETSQGTRVPFSYDKEPVAHEDESSLGILGFGLMWIVVGMELVGVVKSPSSRVLALTAVTFVLTQAYSSPYDPWRGRYFITAGIFACPILSYYFHSKRKFTRSYLIAVVLLGCLSAWGGVIFRKDSALISARFQPYTTRSAFVGDHLSQLTRARPIYYQPLKRFEALVPKDAVVAVYLQRPFYEYPLFGKQLTRTLIPLNDFWGKPKPIPREADFLLYSKDLHTSEPADIQLGPVVDGEWWLRALQQSP